MLEKIVKYKCHELEGLKRKVSLKDVQSKAGDVEPPRPFLEHFGEGINIIAEIKKASPSAGVIRCDFDPQGIAEQYEEGGAKALSILTDSHFFQGSLETISQVKKKVSLPCLRKDFTLDEYHVFEARGANADAILLIGAILEPSQIKDYQALAHELGMQALVEVHDEAELESALNVGASLVGINNRNLKNFVVDVETSSRLIQKIPKGITSISESGLKDREMLLKLKAAGFSGFLIGEHLLRAKNCGNELRALVEG